MKFNYIILLLIMMSILVGFFFRLIIKKNNYELNFKESLLYSCSILLLSILSLIDYRLIRINIGWEFSICIVIYFLILLLIYYIFRIFKIKKYIPIKSIIAYILISVMNLIILFHLLSKSTSNINGWDAFGLYIIYILVCIIFIALLTLINLVIYIIKSIRKDKNNYKNEKYIISKYSFFNLAILLLLVVLVFGIDNYNEYNYQKIIEKQKNIVANYLKKEYPDYEFEIINTSETEVDCSVLFCKTPVFKNEIVNKDLNINFVINIKKEDLTVYEDEFKENIKDKLNNSIEDNIKEYILNHYDVSLKYRINENKLEDVRFVLNKKYQKEEIDLFVEDMKAMFIYIENNFYDLDYVEIDFVNRNPFYTGDYEYRKTKGTINDNDFTDELWIMVDQEYIIVSK